MGASPYLHIRFDIGKLEVCELTRVALREHATPVSRIVRIALKLFRQHCPGIRLVVSFADPHEGHVGSIYMAMGWTYTGTTATSFMYRDRKGKLWHDRNISAVGECRGDDRWRTRKHSAEGMTKEKRPGKHRYVVAIDRSLKDQVERLTEPYPNRCVESADSGTAHDQ